MTGFVFEDSGQGCRARAWAHGRAGTGDREGATSARATGWSGGPRHGHYRKAECEAAGKVAENDVCGDEPTFAHAELPVGHSGRGSHTPGAREPATGRQGPGDGRASHGDWPRSTGGADDSSRDAEVLRGQAAAGGGARGPQTPHAAASLQRQRDGLC